jgi:WhiB family redox-sensing transcriptional regulator
MSAELLETDSYGIRDIHESATKKDDETRAPKLTQREAAFLLARGPFLARVAAQEKLLAYYHAITPKDGAYGPLLPEYVEGSIREELGKVQKELEDFNEEHSMAEVISITNLSEVIDRDDRKSPPGEKAVELTVRLSSSVTIVDKTENKNIDWRVEAVCAQTDQEAFFPEKGGSTREAKKVCLSCEVREKCLEWALANDERHGVWGGLSERERRKLKRKAI